MVWGVAQGLRGGLRLSCSHRRPSPIWQPAGALNHRLACRAAAFALRASPSARHYLLRLQAEAPETEAAALQGLLAAAA